MRQSYKHTPLSVIVIGNLLFCVVITLMAALLLYNFQLFTWTKALVLGVSLYGITELIRWAFPKWVLMIVFWTIIFFPIGQFLFLFVTK